MPSKSPEGTKGIGGSIREQITGHQPKSNRDPGTPPSGGSSGRHPKELPYDQSYGVNLYERNDAYYWRDRNGKEHGPYDRYSIALYDCMDDCAYPWMPNYTVPSFWESWHFILGVVTGALLLGLSFLFGSVI